MLQIFVTLKEDIAEMENYHEHTHNNDVQLIKIIVIIYDDKQKFHKKTMKLNDELDRIQIELLA
jgi:hypothetical protein